MGVVTKHNEDRIEVSFDCGDQ
eukprot:SAG11_NODE_53901_length_102_cov_69.000000_1_plen_21_part_01